MGVGICELRESLREYAAGFDAAVLSAAQAAEVVEQASRIEKMAATVKALAAARMAETGSWRADGDRSAAHQLARRTGTSVVQAAAAIDTARRLGSLPQTSAAARRGELSAEQASAIADAAGADPGAEHLLLEAARRSPLAELREQCARTKAAAHVDLEARRRRIHSRRSLRSFTDAEGEWHLHCRNNPEVGARILAALDPIREEIFRRARAEARHEPPDAYAADALAEMARRSWQEETEPSTVEPENVAPAADPAAAEMARRSCGRDADEPGAVEPGNIAPGSDPAGAEEAWRAIPAGAEEARRAIPAVGTETAGSARGSEHHRGTDAVGASATAGRASRRKASRRPGSPKVIVRVDLATLLGGYPNEGEVCEIAGVGPVAVSAVRDMIDATIRS